MTGHQECGECPPDSQERGGDPRARRRSRDHRALFRLFVVQHVRHCRDASLHLGGTTLGVGVELHGERLIDRAIGRTGCNLSGEPRVRVGNCVPDRGHVAGVRDVRTLDLGEKRIHVRLCVGQVLEVPGSAFDERVGLVDVDLPRRAREARQAVALGCDVLFGRACQPDDLPAQEAKHGARRLEGDEEAECTLQAGSESMRGGRRHGSSDDRPMLAGPL